MAFTPVYNQFDSLTPSDNSRNLQHSDLNNLADGVYNTVMSQVNNGFTTPLATNNIAGKVMIPNASGLTVDSNGNLTPVFGTSVGTIMQGNDARVVGATAAIAQLTAANFLTASTGVTSVNGSHGAVSLTTQSLADVAQIAPSQGMVLTYNGTAWAPATPAGTTGVANIPNATPTQPGKVAVPLLSGLTVDSSGNVAIVYGTTANTAVQGNDPRIVNATTLAAVANVGYLTASTGVTSVNGSKGPVQLVLKSLSDVSSTTPTTGQVLSYNGTQWAPTAPTAGQQGQTGPQGPAGTTPTLNAFTSGTGYVYVTNGVPSVTASGGSSGGSGWVSGQAYPHDGWTTVAMTSGNNSFTVYQFRPPIAVTITSFYGNVLGGKSGTGNFLVVDSSGNNPTITNDATNTQSTTPVLNSTGTGYTIASGNIKIPAFGTMQVLVYNSSGDLSNGINLVPYIQVT